MQVAMLKIQLSTAKGLSHRKAELETDMRASVQHLEMAKGMALQLEVQATKVQDAMQTGKLQGSSFCEQSWPMLFRH